MTEGVCGKIVTYLTLFPQMALMSDDHFLITYSHWEIGQVKNAGAEGLFLGAGTV